MAMTSGIMWYGQQIHPGEWHGKATEPAELLDMLKGMGLETVDIFARTVEQWDLDTIRSALDSSGLRCACYYISADLVSEEPEKVAAADAAFPSGIEQAQALGAPVCFTHGSQHAHEGDENFQRYVDRLGEKVALFEGTGMTLVIENAGTLLHKAPDMLRIMDALADDGLRLCPDTGNFTLWRQDEVEAVRMLLPYSAHFHIKDYGDLWEEDDSFRGREFVLGEGITPMDEIFALIKGSDFDGVVAWEPGPHDEAEIEQSVKKLLELIG